jgi:hypothetical protein
MHGCLSEVTTMNKPKRWRQKHQREALRRIYEIAGEAVAACGEDVGLSIAVSALWSAASEQHFRDGLAEAKFDHARIEREVRRVRGLAEGRLKRVRMVQVHRGGTGGLVWSGVDTPDNVTIARALWRERANTRQPGRLVYVTTICRTNEGFGR